VSSLIAEAAEIAGTGITLSSPRSGGLHGEKTNQALPLCGPCVMLVRAISAISAIE
jgi:hypothetical protein